jgi:hypothetical protein
MIEWKYVASSRKNRSDNSLDMTQQDEMKNVIYFAVDSWNDRDGPIYWEPAVVRSNFESFSFLSR